MNPNRSNTDGTADEQIADVYLADVDEDVLAEALLDLASDLPGDHTAEPTVVVLGDVPTYGEKVPDEYADHVGGKQVDSFRGIPVIQFKPRYAHMSDDGERLILGDGHLGDASYPNHLPAEFEHTINTDEYVTAVIYQEEPVDGGPSTEFTTTGNQSLSA